MAIVTVKASKTGKKLLRYVLNGKPHHPDQYVEERNLYLSGIDCPILYAESAMSALWKDTRCKNQLFSIVQSFRDLDYRNPDNVKDVHEAGVELAKRLLKKLGVKRQVLVATQADGSSHHLHNHILINNCDENGRGIPHGIYVGKVMDINDRIVVQMPGQEHEVQDELISQKKQWQKKDYRHSYEPDLGISKKDKKYNLSEIGLGINQDLKNKHQYRTKKHEQHLQQPDSQYIIRAVSSAIRSAQSKEEFVKLLAEQDVQVKLRKRQKSINWQAKNLSFIRKGHKRALRSTTIDKNLTAENILKQLEQNHLTAIKQQQVEELRRHQVAQEVLAWQREEERKRQKKQQAQQVHERGKTKLVTVVEQKEPEPLTATKQPVKDTPLDSLIANWPYPHGVTNLTSKYNCCLDPSTIREDNLPSSREQMQFERNVELLRNRQISKYQRFSQQRKRDGLVRIGFGEFFAMVLYRRHRTLVKQCMKALIRKEAVALVERLNKLLHRYRNRAKKKAPGGNGPQPPAK